LLAILIHGLQLLLDRQFIPMALKQFLHKLAGQFALENEQRQSLGKRLGALRGMTLTVVDGDFPREVLRDRNLTFAPFEMPGRRNNAIAYDARLAGPGYDRGGVLVRAADHPKAPARPGDKPWWRFW